MGINTKRKDVLHNIVSVFPELLFLVITIFIFIPSSLFLNNIKELSVNYLKVFILLMTFAVFMSLAGIVFACILQKQNLILHYRALLFSLALGFYLQSNFLNPDLPELNGAAIDWSKFRTQGFISTLLWLLCIIGLQIAAFYWKKRVSKLTKYVSMFLTAVQVLTLVVLVISTSKPNASTISLTKEDEFTIGTNKNIIVFVLDSLGSEKFEDIVTKDQKMQESLQNFTFFKNAVSGGAYTSVAMPVLLTGIEFDPTWQDYGDYLEGAWSDTTFYRDLKKQNYDIRIYSDSRYITKVSDDIISNAKYSGEGYEIQSRLGFIRSLYKLTCFYAMPQIMKESFWMYSDDLTSHIQPVEEKEIHVEEQENEFTDESSDGQYSFDDVQFYQDFINSGRIQDKYQNTFRLYHLNGAHEPYTMNENIETAITGVSTEEQQIEGCMKIVDSYIQKLKETGAYDQSMIVITADHGRAGYEDGLQQNPCLLIKMPSETHPLEINDMPVHFRNVMATMAKTAFDNYSEYGPCVYDIDQNSDVERLHTVASPVCKEWFPDISNERAFARFIISNNARDVEAIQYYNPEEINRIDYKMEDIIDFSKELGYTKQINYRIYKEDSVGVLSNEFSMYANLLNYQGGDLQLRFICSKVYNDKQNIRIYIKGEKAADINCTSMDVGREISVNIPADYVKESTLPIRMVFPNAVTPKQVGDDVNDSRVLSIAIERMQVVEE